jgi:hypothetical protein
LKGKNDNRIVCARWAGHESVAVGIAMLRSRLFSKAALDVATSIIIDRRGGLTSL